MEPNVVVELASGTHPPLVKQHRRSSPGGQALHRWHKQGKYTTIHIVYELDEPITKEALVELVDVALLQRFPRFRGYVSANERYWCVPDKVDATRYVEMVELSTDDDGTDADVEAAVQQHVARSLGQDLPEQCSWQAQLVTCSGAAERCFVIWRIAHTVADGVILSQIMSNVLCKALVKDPDPGEAPSTPSVLNPAGSSAKVTNLRSQPTRVGLCERLRCLVGGVAFVLALVFWPSDPRTPIKLGPYKWERRERARRAAKGLSAHASATDASQPPPPAADAIPVAVDDERERLRLGVMQPVAVDELKAAAAFARVSVNDLLLAAMAGGIRAYMNQMEPHTRLSASLQIHAVAVINPRPVMPQMGPGGASELLNDYAAMKGPGCDITLGILPLPCGDLPARTRLERVAHATRFVKISPETYLLRLLANLLVRSLGLSVLLALYKVILAKFTTYVSNVVAPPLAGSLCGVRIKRIFFGTAPLDFGVSFSFLSYAGQCTLTCTSDAETVPSPQLMTDCVRAHLLEQMAAAKEAPAAGK